MPMTTSRTNPMRIGCDVEFIRVVDAQNVLFLSIPTALPFTDVIPNPGKHTLRFINVNKARRIGSAKIHRRSPLLLKLALISRSILLVVCGAIECATSSVKGRIKWVLTSISERLLYMRTD